MTKKTAVVAGTYSRTNPAPIGKTQNIKIDSYSSYGNYDADVTIKEVIRGETANKMVQEANMFNDAPKDGNEYLLLKVAIKVNSVADDGAVKLSLSMFNFFSSDNAEYPKALFTVVPEPTFSGQLYAGASSEGWLVAEVDKKDTAPKCVFESKYDGTGGIWFSLSE